MTRVLAMVDLPLVKAMAPARLSRPISVISSPFKPARHRGHDVNVDDGVVAGAALDEVDERHLIDDRLGVGHDDDGRDAAGGGGVARGLQRFAMLVAGFAGEDLRVDQAGGEDMAVAIDDRGAVGRVAAQMGADVGDDAVARRAVRRARRGPRRDRSGGR